MKAWKAYIAIFFLAILSVSLVPKSFWHDCDHGHEVALDGSSQEVDFDNDCQICDYNFSAADLEVGLVLGESQPATMEFSVFFHDFTLISTHLAQPLRGPPHC